MKKRGQPEDIWSETVNLEESSRELLEDYERYDDFEPINGNYNNKIVQ